MADQDIQIKIDVAVKDSEAANSIQEIRQSLRELNSLALEVGDTNSEAYRKAATAAGELNDRLDDLRQNTRSLSGEPIERLGGSIGQVRNALTNLDFGQVQAGLNNIRSTIGGFGGAVNLVGEAFNGLGNIIKSNPILLFAGVIALIVTNFNELVEAGGVVGKVFGVIKDIVDNITGAFTALTDAIGLTDLASADRAEKEKARREEEAKDIQDVYDLQVKLAQLAGKETTKLELENTFIKKKQVTDRIIEIGKEAQANREVTEESKKELKELNEAYDKYANNITYLNAKILQNRQNLNERLVDADIAAMKDGAAKTSAERNREYDKLRTDVANQGGTIVEAARIVADKQAEYRNKDAKDAEAKRKQEANENTQANNKRLQETAKRIAKEKQLAEGELKENSNIRELILLNDTEVSEERFKRLEENTLKRIKFIQDNEKKLYGVEGGTQAALDLKKLDDQIVTDRKAYADNIIAIEDAKSKAIIEKQLAEAQSNKQILDAKLSQSIDNQRKELQAANLTEEQKTAIVAKGEAERKILTDQYNSDKLQRALDNESRRSQLEYNLATLSGKLDDRLKAIERLYASEKQQRDADFADQINNAKKSGEEIQPILDEQRDADKAADKQAQQEKLQAFVAAGQQKVQYAQAGASALSALNDFITQNEKNSLKAGEKFSLEVQKRQFIRTKALNIVNGIINTAQAVLASLALGPPQGFILAGISAAAGLVQVATIAKQKFNPDSTSASISSPAPLAGSAAAAEAAAPTFQAPQLFGLGGGQFTSGVDSNQRVYVLEGDISRSQGRVASIRNNARLER